MHRPTIVALAALFAFLAPAKAAPVFNGARALDYTRRIVAFGPRPAGSPAIRRLQAFILADLRPRGCQIQQDDFTASTPDGSATMKNILCRFPGRSGRSVVFTGHYDTKKLPSFVGANDGGSSAGFLLELAQALATTPHADDIDIVFLDGEEAVHDWTDTDSLYGSRHLAAKWAADGTVSKVKALINVDMIGDRNLDLLYDGNSSASLRELVWKVADELGYSANFPRQESSVEDDHIPFLRDGIRALDVIDLDYGPNNSYWHTPKDTLDKLSAHSFEVVGRVLLAAIPEIEAQH